MHFSIYLYLLLYQAFLFLCPAQEELLLVRLTDQGQAKRKRPQITLEILKKEIGKKRWLQEREMEGATGGPHLECRR